MKLRNLRLKKIAGLWRVVEWLPWDKCRDWGNYRVIWPKWPRF